MIKYFISDLDGTLLFRNVGIKQSDIKALNKSIQDGINKKITQMKLFNTQEKFLDKVKRFFKK